MKTHPVVLTLAATSMAAAQGHAQTWRPAAPSLPAFQSEAELRAFFAPLATPPPPAPLPPPPAPAQPSASTPPLPATPPPCDATQAAASAVIHGRVTDVAGAPQSAVSVRIAVLNRGTVTAADGRYCLSLSAATLPAGGTVVITASRVGMKSQAWTLTPVAGDTTVANFQLAADAISLEGVVVTGVGTLQGKAAGASITNVQHAGVDEGGIVKLHGDHLVILRRGRLFTVRVGDRHLRPVAAVDAFGPGLSPDGAWYDEMLVSGDVIAVIGYSYERDGTEIGLFRIGRDGSLAHRSTYHLRSNDYYSSRNYASRLVDDKLVFYTPLHLEGRRIADGDDLAELLPALRRWRPGGKDDAFRPIASARRIYRPAGLAPQRAGALHTVTVCDIARAEMDCRATGVLGPWSEVFYVSPHAAFVWLGGFASGGESPLAASTVYQIPLDGTEPRALGVTGSPIDQFSFLESDDGYLNVLVGEVGPGQWMWRPEWGGKRGELALLRVPLSRFGDGLRHAPASAYLPLPGETDDVLHNRFVGDHLLFGTGTGWDRPRTRGAQEVVAVNWRTRRVSRLGLPHGVDRIEAMGTGAVVVGADERDLHFTSVRLGGRPATVDRFTLTAASQGETRSHGFFYRADTESTGLLGLPVRGPGRPGYEHLFQESASIVFLRNRALRLRGVGELAARAEGQTDDACRASCVDWYGNARPLFLRGRVFALMGYELVEGREDGGRIREVRRVSFAPGAVGR